MPDRSIRTQKATTLPSERVPCAGACPPTRTRHDTRTRALGPGWHLAETVGCDVLKASVADAVIKFGNLTIVRVLPGSVGLAELNGQPLLLSPGTHLVRLTRTTPPARCARNCDPNDPNTHLARAPRP